jgi:predicted nucleotidyltransferase
MDTRVAEIKDVIDGQTFSGRFTPEQLSFIAHVVVTSARKTLGDKLKEVILFGSYARGDYTEWSDVDIMLLIDEDDQITVQRLCEKVDGSPLLTELMIEMCAPLSTIAVPYSRFERIKAEYPFYRNVDREGVRIYVG